MTPKNKPLELLEESLHTLRAGGIPILVNYWLGAVPFAAALLWLMHDMRLSWGGDLLLRDGFFCAVAFVWLSYWKSRAARATWGLLVPEELAEVTWYRSIYFQTVFQASKLFVAPLAVASLAGWPAASGFFRSLALEPVSRDRTLRAAMSKAFTIATGRYKENQLACLVIAALTITAYINVLVVFLGLPVIWKTLTGYETEWSRMGSSTVGGLAFVSVVATWLVIDPWIQTYFLLRIFYQDARSDGKDLLREIARLGVVVLLFVLIVTVPARASQPDQKRLDESIERAAQSNDYGWLRAHQSKEERGFLADLGRKVDHALTATARRIEAWLDRLFRQQEQRSEHQSTAPPQSKIWRWMLGALALIACGLIVSLFLRRGTRRKLTDDAVGGSPTIPNVFNEQMLPSDVKQDEWLRLAFEYLANDNTRLAARAFYLANLSYLGSQSLLALSLTKSNRIYERELARQARSPQIARAFSDGNRLYERAWYGMRELGAEQVETLKGAVEQLRQHA